MKTTKYKLSDMAKDLKVTNNDLIEWQARRRAKENTVSAYP